VLIERRMPIEKHPLYTVEDKVKGTESAWWEKGREPVGCEGR